MSVNSNVDIVTRNYIVRKVDKRTRGKDISLAKGQAEMCHSKDRQGGGDPNNSRQLHVTTSHHL